MSPSVWKRLLEPHVPLKRRYRRALVLAFHGGYAALLVFLVPELSTPVLEAAYFTLLACWLLIFMTTDFTGDKREKKLDERQRNVRDRAHRYAYVLLVGVAFIVYWTSAKLDLGTLAMYALLSYAVLPSSVIAWLEPDPVLDDATSRLEVKL